MGNENVAILAQIITVHVSKLTCSRTALRVGARESRRYDGAQDDEGFHGVDLQGIEQLMFRNRATGL